jgi:hypothetical protein
MSLHKTGGGQASTNTDIQTPLSASSSPFGPNVEAFAPLPRPPWLPSQRKISHSPDPTAPKVGGVPQSQHFLQPHFPNHAKLAEMSDTFNIGVRCSTFILPEDNTVIRLEAKLVAMDAIVEFNSQKHLAEKVAYPKVLLEALAHDYSLASPIFSLSTAFLELRCAFRSFVWCLLLDC